MKHMKFSLILALALIVSLAAQAADLKGAFVVIDDEASIKDTLQKLTNGSGKKALEKKDVYKEDDDGKAAIRINVAGGDGQNFNPGMPDWEVGIEKKPTRPDQFRYITFAWKKIGGDGIQLQLHANVGGWGHRYHAGANVKNWNPSIQVNKEVPEKWEVHTRDLIEDWKDLSKGGMKITGIAFTAWDGKAGLWDHVVFHQTPEDPLAPQAVDVKAKLAVKWGEIKQ